MPEPKPVTWHIQLPPRAKKLMQAVFSQQNRQENKMKTPLEQTNAQLVTWATKTRTSYNKERARNHANMSQVAQDLSDRFFIIQDEMELRGIFDAWSESVGHGRLDI